MQSSPSRTPEGRPGGCPLCGAEVRVEPSLFFGDAPCPRCGQLLWFLQIYGAALLFSSESERDRIRLLIEARLAQRPTANAAGAFVDDLGADSLDRVEVVVELEDELGYSLGDPEDRGDCEGPGREQL